METKRKATVGVALIPLAFLLVSLYFALKLEEAHIALFASAMFAALIANKMLGISWSELEEGVVETIKMSMGAIIILLIIGMVVGTWIQAGIVPVMISIGLNILSPGIFLVATVLFCSVVSLATGSAWTTASTVGIALVGVGSSLGIPLEMIGGAIISGAYFGDKISPLSDTTNLAPAVSGADLFDHIKHMFYTTIPSYIVTLIVFGIMGARFAGGTIDPTQINEIQSILGDTFNLNPALLLVPVIVIVIVVMKTPAIPGLFIGAALGGVAAMIFQGTGLLDVMNAAQNGCKYAIPEGAEGATYELVKSLLSKGGMQGMLWTVSLILCAMVFGGVMEKSGMLGALAEGILSVAQGTGNLIFVTLATCIVMNFIAGDQYLAIVLPGRMYKASYEEHGLHPKNLSRALEDSATLTSPLIPWNTCGATMIAVLGLAPWVYVPYCVLNWLNPIVSTIYGYTGFSIVKLEESEAA